MLLRGGVTIDGVFGLDIGFIDHLHTRLGTTSSYSAAANLHTLQVTTAHAKSVSFTSRSLITASNSEDSSASALRSTLNAASCRLTWLPQLSSL
jgi:hypothetical protein